MFLPIVSAIVLFIAGCADGNSDNTSVDNPAGETIQVRSLTNKLDHAWEILWGPDGKIWVTERKGKISRIDPTTGQITAVVTIADVKARGEGGLLGMVLHPDFKNSPYVYVSYNYQANGYKEKVVRFKYEGSALTDPKVLLDNISASGIHNGSRLAISTDLHLYITTGDASNQADPQNIGTLNGKVLRLNLDGTIPADNPFLGSPVWSYGHRNPQGLVFANGRLYSSEHGPNTDDEINIIGKQNNYGWPNVRGYCDESDEQTFCTGTKVTEPVHTWTPTAAVSGIDYYGGKAIAGWNNSLLVTSLKNATLYQLKLNDAGDKVVQQNTFLKGKYGRLRDICVSPDGKVYVSTSNGDEDQILELTAK